MSCGQSLNCPRCGAPRGTNKYCWNCVEEKSGNGVLLPLILIEDLLKFDIRKTRKQKRYGSAVTVNGVLRQAKLNGDGGSK